MDLVQENNCGSIIEHEYTEKLLCTEATDICDEYRDPELLPCVGIEYQAEIPPLIAKNDYLLLTDSSTDAKMLSGIPYEVLVGLPISVMWINEEVKDIKSDGHDIKHRVETVDVTLDGEIDMTGSSILAGQPEIRDEMHHKNTGRGYRPVPGSAADTWSDIDEAGFLLGLYIFGKNLIQVNKFVKSKRMAEVLSFYYGKFYGSDKYRRWSECRKMKSRKCIYGQRIFTGLRQQELLSRLLPHVSEECQNNLMEDLKAFGDGKMSLQEYVLALRDKVGLNIFVEAVGIGKGKQDLTGMAMDSLKPNQGVTARPEIPTGKAWSLLTHLEIINFLTGGYRLSKGRSSDLFWEAVWPRLLARGWHSEESINYGCAAGSKHSLVFLVPGIKKFSRRKLVKGDHYFDSISDVLNKVAEEPGLLELDIGKDKGDSSKDENGWTDETKLDQQDFPDQQRQCYLKPRAPNRGIDSIKFTVIDTSLANGGILKVRELRSLPVEMRNHPTLRSHSEDTDGETSEEPMDESDSSDTICSHRNKEKGLKRKILNGPFDGNPNGGFEINALGLNSATAVQISDQKSNMCDDLQPKKTIKSQLNQRLKFDDDIYIGPVTKRRRRLKACNRTVTTSSSVNGLLGPKLKQHEARCWIKNLNLGENISFQVDPSLEKLSSTNSSSKGSPVVSCEGTLGSTSSGVEHPCEEPPLRRMIDLNLPVSPDAEFDEPYMKEGTERQHDQTSRLPDNPSVASENVVASEQQPEVNARRHSTRNRPLTTKALEALAFGFLSTKQKRRFGDSFQQENPLASCRARGKARVTENIAAGVLVPDLRADEQENDQGKDNGTMYSEFQV